MSAERARAIAEFDRTQAAAAASVTLTRPDATQRVHGAYTASTGRAAPPFFEDHTLVLSRPAHLRDYQGDSAAYPFRTPRPEELTPYVAPPVPLPDLPKLVFTSDAEQRWLQERDLARRSEEAAAASASVKDFSRPPPPFVSKLGFRSPEPMPPQPQPVKEFCHQDGVSKEFFYGGTGRFVSENGTANSQQYYRLARPLAGRAKSHYPSQTTAFGYRFDRQ